jgi:hypothetical protein
VLFSELHELLPCFQRSQAHKPLRSMRWPAPYVAGPRHGYDDKARVCSRLMDLRIESNIQKSWLNEVWINSLQRYARPLIEAPFTFRIFWRFIG